MKLAALSVVAFGLVIVPNAIKYNLFFSVKTWEVSDYMNRKGRMKMPWKITYEVTTRKYPSSPAQKVIFTGIFKTYDHFKTMESQERKSRFSDVPFKIIEKRILTHNQYKKTKQSFKNKNNSL